MGYTTYFSGAMTINPPLDAKQVAYINKFSNTRRMKRHTHLLPVDPIREAVGLPAGEDGEYFVGAGGDFGQGDHPSIVDYNESPATQPSLWCKWEVSEDGTTLEWNEAEKFYAYTEWLQYLVLHFLAPWGRTLEGEITWSGEEDGDTGTIYAHGHAVEAVDDLHTNAGPSWGKAATK